MKAGRLRHRVDIQRPEYSQDETTGEMIVSWVTVWEKAPASVEPASVSRFVAAAAAQSKVVGQIVIRYRSGVEPTMRVLHRNKIYVIEGVLADKESGLDYLTLAVSEGVSDGG